MPARHDGAFRIAVIDLRSRSSRLIPGAMLDGYRQLAWTASGDRLLFTAGPSRLMAWPRDGGRPVPAVEVRGTIMDMATSR